MAMNITYNGEPIVWIFGEYVLTEDRGGYRVYHKPTNVCLGHWTSFAHAYMYADTRREADQAAFEQVAYRGKP